MGIMVALLEPLGEPFACHLSEYMRTIVYRMPAHIVREGHLSPAIVHEIDDFRASIVTDPFSYLSASDFSDQYGLDITFPGALQEKCGIDPNDFDRRIYVVIQFRQDMKSFPAVDGQCFRRESEGTEFLLISDCDDAPAPRPDTRIRTIDTVLAAAKVEFGITEGFEKAFDAGCYKTDKGDCVHPYNIEFRVGGVTVLSPMTLEDLTAKAEATGVLAAQMAASIDGASRSGQRRRIPEFGTRLEDLIGALWLKPSLDDAYLQLWYLQLWDRLEKLGDAFRPRLQVLNDPKLEDEKSHRKQNSASWCRGDEQGTARIVSEGNLPYPQITHRSIDMYKNDERFSAPPGDAVLWRYMSFTKFASLLARNALFFARADKLGDPFEGALSPVNVALRPVLYKDDFPEDKRNLIGDFMKDLRRFMLVNCWHENENESDAMWKLYSNIQDGIAIKTDFQSLSGSLRGSQEVRIGRINYVDYETTFIPENDAFKPIMFKRKSFEHEHEVRAVILEIPPSGDEGFVVGRQPSVYEDGAYHEVDTSMLIKEVLVPPYAEDWFTELVRATAATFNLGAPVRKSSLAVQPVWR